MNKIEVKEILDYLENNYVNFKVTQDMFNMWLDELQQYDKEDVMNKLKQMIGTGTYRVQPPVLVSITNGLQKTSNKIDWTKIVTFCPKCNKAFQCDENMYSQEYVNHRGKCNSIEYVIRQTKKWFNKDLTRGELWAMPEKEFNERYDKLLHYIYENTEDETERTFIGYVFNPPKENVFDVN